MASRLATYDDIPGLLVEMDPNFGITMDASNVVSKWVDKKGGLIFTRGSGNPLPTFVADYRNGYAGVVSDGSGSKWLEANLPASMQAANLTVLFAGYFAGNTDGQWRRAMSLGTYSDQNSNSIQIIRMGTGNKVAERTLGGDATYGWTKLDRTVIVTKAGTVGKIYVDTNLSATGVFAATIAGGFYRLLAGIGYDDPWVGGVQSHAVWDHELTQSEFLLATGIASWKTKKNGADLPANHPNKNSPPMISDGGAGDNPVSATETLTASEILAIRAAVAQAASDVLAPVESITARVDLTASTSDVLVPTETATTAVNVIVSVADAAILVEAPAVSAAAVASAADSAALTDAPASQAGATAAASDVLAPMETVSLSVAAVAALADVAALSEARDVSARAAVTVADTVAPSDTATAAASSPSNAGQSDTASLTDATGVTAAAAVAAADVLALTDTPTARAAVSTAVSDVLVPLEAQVVSVNVVLGTTDVVALVEGQPASANARPAMADAGTLVEAWTLRASAVAALVDSWAYSETAAYSVTLPVGSILADTGSFLDVVTVRAGVSFVLGDALALLDVARVFVGVALATTDAIFPIDRCSFTTSAWFGVGPGESSWTSVDLSGDGWTALPNLPPT